MNCSVSIHLLKLSSQCHTHPFTVTLPAWLWATCPSSFHSAPPMYSPTAASVIFIKYKVSHAIPMPQTLKMPIALRIRVLSILTALNNLSLICTAAASRSLLRPCGATSGPQNKSLLFFASDPLHAFFRQTGTFSSPATSFPSLLTPPRPLAVSLVVTSYSTSSLTLQNDVDTFPRCHNSSMLITPYCKFPVYFWVFSP